MKVVDESDKSYLKLTTKVKRGTATRDQDTTKVVTRHHDPTKAVEQHQEAVKQLENLAQQSRDIDPSRD
jgi:hypothetical protein